MPFTFRFMLVMFFHAHITTIATTTICTALGKLRVPFVLADLTLVLEFFQYAYIFGASAIVVTATLDSTIAIAIPVTVIVADTVATSITTGASTASPFLPREHDTRNTDGFLLDAITVLRYVL